MTHKRLDRIKELATGAGLVVESVVQGRHYKLKVRTEDGRRATVVAPVSGGDHRGELNLRTTMRRIAAGASP